MGKSSYVKFDINAVHDSTMIFLNEIQQHIGGLIRIGEPLAQYTSLGIGGPADYVVEPETKDDVIRAVSYFQARRVPFLLLRRGSNLLVSEEGYRGVAIHVERGMSDLRCNTTPTTGENVLVYAGAGVRIARFVDFCVQRSLSGAEGLAGQEGTLGGWIVRALSERHAPLVDCLETIDVLRRGAVHRLSVNTHGRTGIIPAHHDIVLAATFRFPVGDQEEIMRARRAALREHNAAEPVNVARSCRVFRDPEGHRAARLLEKAGVGGWVQGRARVWERDPNVVIAELDARAVDVLELITHMHRAVRKELGVALDLRVKLVGMEVRELQEVA